MNTSPEGLQKMGKKMVKSGPALVSVVVPVYNEESCVAEFVEQIQAVASNLNYSFEIVFVDDGSEDATLVAIKGVWRTSLTIVAVSLSRNFGKEAALTAGLSSVSGEVVIVMDVDLQDPPELIGPMLKQWESGYAVVVGKRISRNSDAIFKRITSKIYYWAHNLLSHRAIPEQVGDFRLMDARVVHEVLRLQEANRFMKGVFAWVGFRTTTVEYERPARSKGTTKFSPLKLFGLGLEGITSFSNAPLRVVTFVGLTVASLGFIYALYLVFRVIFSGIDVPGYASLLVATVALSGLQLIALGVIGEYVGKAFIETKRRPIYVIDETWTNDAGR